MSRPETRLEMSAVDFEAIPTDHEYPLEPLYVTLIDENERVYRELCLESGRGVKGLTAGQQTFVTLGAFDNNVCNGGITQFFWNKPEAIFTVRDLIEELGETVLLSHYERAMESLIGKKKEWLNLRNEWALGQDNPKWESFQATYDLLKLGWFEDVYFDQRAYNPEGEWVVVRRGLGYSLMSKLARYVRGHPDEFFVEPSAG